MHEQIAGCASVHLATVEFTANDKVQVKQLHYTLLYTDYTKL